MTSALSFEDYLQLTKDIVDEKVVRTGLYQADNTFRYTRSNLERMNKVLNNIVLSQKLYNALSDLKEEWVWVVISEPWCGDASWGTPALAVIASATDKIDFKILLRDTNPDIIKAYQTAGSDSIPKLICIRKRDWAELGTWGPRPQLLHQQVLAKKNSPDFDYKESVRAIHAWYEEDMTKTIQEEMIDCVKQWMAN
ncbi:MAG: thioredoxin family protein [Chitinophagales bacterium]|nr:thioredoxin family protein [Chitinophagales bacterium]